MTFDDLMVIIERLIVCKDGLPCAVSQTGESYTEVANLDHGEKDSFSYSPFFSRESDAINWLYGVISHHLYIRAADCGYSDLSKMTLYWEIKPETTECTLWNEDAFISGLQFPHYSPVTVWRAYARILVTDKLVIYPTLADYEASRIAA